MTANGAFAKTFVLFLIVLAGGAFGLMVTLVWLYLEILRLLAKLRS
jgi:hypothetical protein